MKEKNILFYFKIVRSSMELVDVDLKKIRWKQNKKETNLLIEPPGCGGALPVHLCSRPRGLRSALHHRVRTDGHYDHRPSHAPLRM